MAARCCPCGRPVAISGRRPTCALCARVERRQRAIETRIERAFQLARARQRAARKAA